MLAGNRTSSTPPFKIGTFKKSAFSTGAQLSCCEKEM